MYKRHVWAKLPIAVRALKSTLLKRQLAEITRQLTEQRPPEELNALMHRYMELKRLSMEFDKFNGEIVITPGAGGSYMR